MLYVCLYVCPLPFFSWKEQAMTKVMKAEVNQNGNLKIVMEKKNRVPTKKSKLNKIKVVQNCMTWRENWSKILESGYIRH